MINVIFCWTVTGFTTEDELLDSYTVTKVDENGNVSSEFETTSPILAGIVFENEFIDGAFPKNIKVKLKMIWIWVKMSKWVIRLAFIVQIKVSGLSKKRFWCNIREIWLKSGMVYRAYLSFVPTAWPKSKRQRWRWTTWYGFILPPWTYQTVAFYFTLISF